MSRFYTYRWIGNFQAADGAIIRRDSAQETSSLSRTCIITVQTGDDSLLAVAIAIAS